MHEDDNKPIRLSASQENYLEWIYRFDKVGGLVRVRDIADKLGVKLPSVSRAVSQLAKLGLVQHESYGVIDLTERGRSAGQAIVRRDECLTRLLVDVLAMSREQADPEVHRLEHVLDEEVLRRLEVLIEFATSSEAWLRRLHHRIGRIELESNHEEGIAIGSTSVHAGLSSEKD